VLVNQDLERRLRPFELEKKAEEILTNLLGGKKGVEIHKREKFHGGRIGEKELSLRGRILCAPGCTEEAIERGVYVHPLQHRVSETEKGDQGSANLLYPRNRTDRKGNRLRKRPNLV